MRKFYVYVDTTRRVGLHRVAVRLYLSAGENWIGDRSAAYEYTEYRAAIANARFYRANVETIYDALDGVELD